MPAAGQAPEAAMCPKPPAPPPHPVSASSSPERESPRRLDSRSLFGDANVVLIAHEGEVYSLRRTRLGRLILTK